MLDLNLIYLNGNAGCNNFFGNYEIKGNNERVTSSTGMTRMLCADEIMLLEDSLIGLISDGVSEVHTSGKQLSV